MLSAHRIANARLQQLAPDSELSEAQWIDLCRPTPEEVAAVERLGFSVPSLADMEEIEISNRLYFDGDTEVLTVSLPGLGIDSMRTFGPVAFLFTETRLVSVRHHAPRPFETFPGHAHGSAAGCASVAHLFLGLVEEIIARLADLIEEVGRTLDKGAKRLFTGEAPDSRMLEAGLRAVGREGEALASYRLSLLTLERALTTFGLNRQGEHPLRDLIKARVRDIQALLVHADFLSGRVAHVTDVTLGLVNLEQSTTGRIVSVVAVLFLPPTLVASVYGMNFAALPGLDHPSGWLIASGLMVVSALGTYLFFRWKGWL